MEEELFATPMPQEFTPERKPETAVHSSHAGDLLWNALTLLLVIAFLGSLVYFGMVYTNPGAGYNLFPPPALPQTLVLPTRLPTSTPQTLAPTPTLANTLAPDPSATPIPPTPTAIQATPLTTLGSLSSATPTLKAVNSLYSFVLQADPKAIDGTLFDASHGCTWMGVAGRVTDLQGSPATKQEVQIFGILNGKMVNETSLTGTATQYGPSGYEFTLGSKPVASVQRLWIRLVDQSGIPLSDRVFFDTFTECNKNLIIINFKQVK